MRERVGQLWSLVLTAFFILVLAGCTYLATGNGASSPPGAAPLSGKRATIQARLAYFGWGDNMPPDSAQITYPNPSYTPALHAQAGGTGTWRDPITFGSDAEEFPVGTIIWVPTVRKYFVMEDDCARCDTAWKNGRHYLVDLWTGMASLSDVFSEENCETALTPSDRPLPIVVAPPSDEPVSARPLFDTSNDRCFNGVTYVNVPNSRMPVAASSAAPAILATKASGVAGSDTGILVPLYSYPDDATVWDPLVRAKTLYPNANIVAIVNPDNGPGSAIDPHYVKGIAQLTAAGIGVFGYIHTSYGAASISSLESQMKEYQRWYRPSGMFFDEMANTTGLESYYRELTACARSLGMKTTVGNPGTDTVPSYVGTVSTLVIYENAGFPSASFLSGGWHAGYPASNFAFIAYDVSSLDVVSELNDAPYVRYEYITDQGEPNPYNAPPSYFTIEAENI